MTFAENLDFEVRRSTRRKTLSLQIRDGHVRVMVPARTPERQITALVNKHTDWIETKLAEQAARPRAAPRSYVNGENFGLLGQAHQLKIIDGAPWPAEISGRELIVTIPARLVGTARRTKVMERLHELYRQTALEEFQARTLRCSDRLGISPGAVRVKAYKRRWGSCSSSGELSYNWRLIVAPGEVVDYVVAHEVAHLVEHNHSPDFWRVVEGLMPNYREHQAWLKKNGATLAI